MRTRPMFKGASGSRRPPRPDAVYALIGAMAIGRGFVVCLLDRSPESVYFFPAVWDSGCTAWFGRYCSYSRVLSEESSMAACDSTTIRECTRIPPTEQ